MSLYSIGRVRRRISSVSGSICPVICRADHPYTYEIGRLEAESSSPEEWVSNYYNPAFANMLPDDGFWAAKQVMAFTEPEVRRCVKLAEYSSEAGMST